MLYGEVFKGIAVKYTNLAPDTDISAITENSARADFGSAFVCIEKKGIREKYISEAIKRGACAVVSDTPPLERRLPCVVVENPRRALAQMLSNFYGDPCSSFDCIIGITGTNGKTSQSFMLESIFKKQGVKTGVIGTLQYLIDGDEYKPEGSLHLTTPDAEVLYAIFDRMRSAGVKCVIMEVSSHALALSKVEGIKFSAGIFTNLSPEHLDFHGTMEEYARTKSKLFEICSLSLLNADDIYCPIVEKNAQGALFYSARDKKADFFAAGAQCSPHLSYTLCHGGGEIEIFSPMSGEFTLYNTLAAASAALSLGADRDCVREGIRSLSHIPGRNERLPLSGGFDVIIDFAHTPDGMKNILSATRKITRGRLITLFGCGGDRDRKKRPLMAGVAREYSDVCIVTSDNSRSEEKTAIINDILKGFPSPPVVITDRKEAIEYALSIAREGDVIVLCGKGHEEYEIDKTGMHRFSEREIVFNYIKKEGMHP